MHPLTAFSTDFVLVLLTHNVRCRLFTAPIDNHPRHDSGTNSFCCSLTGTSFLVVRTQPHLPWTFLEK
jgi:hypothetical protein